MSLTVANLSAIIHMSRSAHNPVLVNKASTLSFTFPYSNCDVSEKMLDLNGS